MLTCSWRAMSSSLRRCRSSSSARWAASAARLLPSMRRLMVRIRLAATPGKTINLSQNNARDSSSTWTGVAASTRADAASPSMADSSPMHSPGPIMIAPDALLSPSRWTSSSPDSTMYTP